MHRTDVGAVLASDLAVKALQEAVDESLPLLPFRPLYLGDKGQCEWSLHFDTHPFFAAIFGVIGSVVALQPEVVFLRWTPGVSTISADGFSWTVNP